MVREIAFSPRSGWFPLLLVLLSFATTLTLFVLGVDSGAPIPILLSILLLVSTLVSLFGFLPVAPNQARVLLLFGEYQGSVKESGFYWVNPFFSKKKVSLRIRNFETGSTVVPPQKNPQGKVIHPGGRSAGRPSKVNDSDGNPIDISAIVVWRVVETAEALLEVDDFENYVAIQSEAALRNLASRHPYDSEDHEISLRGNTTEISAQLETDIQERLQKAGVEVIEARISHLAYSAEIAAAMLQRQQAQAVVAARTRIVEGAVGMVEMALAQLQRDDIIHLDDERKATMVSNLLVVLCSDRHTQPVVNAGSLY